MTNNALMKNSSPITLTEAVHFFLKAFKECEPSQISERLATFDVERIVWPESKNGLIHLLCHTTILDQTRALGVDLEKNLALEIAELKDTAWLKPAALALLELRYANGTLSSITQVEKDVIKSFYGLKTPFVTDHFNFHQAGTTSIIFQSGENAVKIVR